MKRPLVVLAGVVLAMAPIAQAQAVDVPLLPWLSDSDESSDERGDSGSGQDDSGQNGSGQDGSGQSGSGQQQDPAASPPGGEHRPPPGAGDGRRPGAAGSNEPGADGEPGALPTGGEPATGQPAAGEWSMTASSLTLRGSRFHGSTQQEMGGETVTTLHFTADGVRARDLVKRADLGNGATLRVAGAPGSVSEIDGPVDMQVRKLSGTLDMGGFPLVPLTLSADVLNVPGLDLSFLKLPDLTFADAVADNVTLSASSLTVPGSRTTVED